MKLMLCGEFFEITVLRCALDISAYRTGYFEGDYTLTSH